MSKSGRIDTLVGDFPAIILNGYAYDSSAYYVLYFRYGRLPDYLLELIAATLPVVAA